MSFQAIRHTSTAGSDSPPESEVESSIFTSSHREPLHETGDIAVVGMACRVAGGNNSPTELWESLLAKRDGVGEMPSMRWEPYYRRDPRNAKVLKNTNKRGYFVEQIENFDASFFGISPKEAVLMDPQQRVTLEVAWEALEDAGISPQSLAGSNTGVFMGVNSDDYGKLLLEDLPGIEAWMGIGTAYCGIPNRISYVLDLMGPSTAVDAACASSLVAIHHGRQALQAHESDVCIVGGVNVLCGPGLTRVLDIAGATSAEGRCRSFDDSANGYGRGEGASIIILKRLEDAINDNDHIQAVLKGSAVAQDGKTNGIMAPNGAAQELVARNALKAAGVDPSTVHYVEAHATSTSVGDPVEVAALAAVYGRNRPVDKPCHIGSVKPNIGHLEAGAGAMGFMKAVLAVKHGLIPPQANLKKLNTKIDWKNSGILAPTETVAWPDTKTRRAAISSYGYGGSVSHAVIESALQFHTTDSAKVYDSEPLDGPQTTLVVLSGPQVKRLGPTAARLKKYVADDNNNTTLASIASTLARRRGHFDHRCVVVAQDKASAIEGLQDVIDDKRNPMVVTGRSLAKEVNPGTVWLFSGHGAQWPAMGKQLLAQDADFLAAIEPLEPIIFEELEFSPIAALENGDFDSSDKIQALTYVMQIGLTASLKERGIQPGAIIGHSVGEIAAAVVAGALTPIEGAKIVARRARLYRQFMGKGAMVMVNDDFAAVAESIKDDSDLSPAIKSSPTSTVVSGSIDAVDKYVEDLKRKGGNPLRVKSDINFHSPALEPLAVPLLEALADDLQPRQPSMMLYTTASSDSRSQPLRDAQYWVSNMVSPVYLSDAVSVAVDDGWRRFLEVSSHPILTHSVNETTMSLDVDDDCVVVPTMVRNKSVDESLPVSIAKLWCSGAAIDWTKAIPCASWAQDVPRTQWMHQPYWKEIGTSDTTTNKHNVDAHVLLGQRTSVPSAGILVYSTTLDQESKPFPGSHPLHGTEIVPAAVLFHTFVKGAAAGGANSLTNITLRVPVAISAPRNLQIVYERKNASIQSQLIGESDANDSWVTHTTAVLEGNNDTTLADSHDVAEIKARLTTRLKDTHTVEYLANVGVSEMGFPWKVTEHWGNTEEMLAKVDVAPDAADQESLPWDRDSWASILDSATSIGSTLFFDEPRLRMPAQVDGFCLKSGAMPPKIGYIYVQKASSGTELASDITVLAEDGEVLAKFTSMRFSEIEGTAGKSGSVESLVHELHWKPATLAEKATDLDRLVLVGSEDATLELYKQQLPMHHRKTATTTTPERFMQTPVSFRSSVIFVPSSVQDESQIPAAADRFCAQLLSVSKHVIAAADQKSQVFVITGNALGGETPTALAQSAVVGLSRIIASEHPDHWGGHIDSDSASLLPLQAIKYVRGADVIRIDDTVAKVARLRPFPRQRMLPTEKQAWLDPTPDGTYIISGGLGVLGLEVAEYLVEKGARRLVLLSRRSLPPRRLWGGQRGPSRELTDKISQLEASGASIFTLAVDLTEPAAHQVLLDRLDELMLPTVTGIIHAAGVLEDQMVLETTEDAFNRVTAPKITGALTLHKAFPPGSLDFFVCFSSCGQLFGFPGQASYASGNSFLDSLAESRRRLGDNAIAFQWTSWRGLGMAASTDFIEAELENRGITSVSRDEGFRAWEYAGRLDSAHAVVLRSLVFDSDEPVPLSLTEDIAVRRPASDAASSESGAAADGARPEGDAMPKSGPERMAYLTHKIQDCVSTVLNLGSADEVDPKVALPKLGMDSVMTVSLRRQLQQTLKVKVPPTLVWGHPTVSHLVKWFDEKLS